MKLKVLIFLFVFISSCAAFAQNIDRLFSEAETHTERLSFRESINSYQKILANSGVLSPSEKRRAQLGLAYSYFLIRDYPNSERFYSQVLNTFPKLKGGEEESYKRYAQVLGLQGKYAESEKFWNRYLDLTNNQDKVKYRNIYNKVGSFQRNQSSYEIEYLNINSGEPEFSPTFYGKGFVFVSGRNSSKIVRRVFGWDDSNFLDLYLLEDVNLLKNKEGSVAGLSASSRVHNPALNNLRNADTGFFTLPTANDSPIPGRSGKSLSGRNTYQEDPLIPTVRFSKKINSKYHEGPAIFYNNDQKIIFTRNEPVKSNFWTRINDNEITKLKLYTAEKLAGKWTNIKELKLGDENYSYGHPALSADEKALFFVSDMPGGYGGTDLYYSVFENGVWSKPVNAGPEINTSENEMFPFLDASDKLYFSSDGHLGLGGLDLFVVPLDIDTKQPLGVVRNLGAPLNSSFDDFGILTNPDRTSGFFSSNRKRGGSDDDIYKFTRIGALYGCRDLTVFVVDSLKNHGIANFRFGLEIVGREGSYEHFTTNADGLVNICLEADQYFDLIFEHELFEKKEASYSNIYAADGIVDTLKVLLKEKEEWIEKEFDEPLINQDDRLIQNWSGENIFKALISNANGDPITEANVKFVNLCDNSVQEAVTDELGHVYFSRDLECDYELISEKGGYTISRDFINKLIEKNLFGRKKQVKSSPPPNQLFNAKLYKTGEVIRLPNIYYSVDEFKLNKEARNELDKLISVMKKYPDMAIEISSHTDSRGSAHVNLALSERRVQEVLKYLSRQIDKGRIKALGKGESEPVNNCGDGVQCTEKEYAKNRRTEFKILRMERL